MLSVIKVYVVDHQRINDISIVSVTSTVPNYFRIRYGGGGTLETKCGYLLSR